ncbi:ABC transporter G family member [Phanerochaete sordida]|uniref:ABC transporter G family member n=1 Tax=Phanerochaete sordida TaxID=48140 RepID=A0A9P3G880_9APHY|nr:ABC transporter G family member [Phanerochaete sordida]
MAGILWILALSLGLGTLARNTSLQVSLPPQSWELSSLAKPDECPPCFNCKLPAFSCGHYGECSDYDGQCKCPPGWAGIDCLTPQCDSLADGEKRRQREDGQPCDCKDGWGGINCNVCQTDAACANFPLPHLPGELGSLDDGVAENMTCYKGGDTVFQSHQMCDVTNRKILDMLPDRPPQVTFGCDKHDGTCSFQFWAAQVESFYCALDECQSSVDYGTTKNTTKYDCQNIHCKCVPGRFICGENGSLNIDEFLNTEITGPATFSCTTGQGCKFEEPGMNGLIEMFFGDSYITLQCSSGECLHYSQVPGYIAPPKPDTTRFIALSVAGVGLAVLLVCAGLWYVGRTRSGDFGGIRLPEAETARLMMDHVPASLHFSDISYTLGNRTILDGIAGSVHPGQLMAIMGASGAGKSTFLDILARKNKRGTVGGRTLVNGREVPDADFKKVMGFVDQEDTLMSTLTVYETVLYSALLRLPREMSLEAKKFRTLETLHELGILGIKDSRIGDSGRRSISGGEKRRVSIACELVTSPSILFLDEPTSGLDAYNALSVIDSLVSLARDYNRTVIFTIHQPRSNIVSLFDKLVLLSHGKLIYSGDASKCYEYLDGIGKPCPPGFNLADYLIDMTVLASIEPRSLDSPATNPELSEGETERRDEEQAIPSSSSTPYPIHGRQGSDEPAPSTTAVGTSSNFIKRKTSQLLEAISPSHTGDAPLSPKLAALVDGFARSAVHAQLQAEIAEAEARGAQHALPDVALENKLTRGRQRASWGTQFRILSGRAFKNLYRDPALLATHYIAAIAVAIICGILFYHSGNDIRGFQNRLGVFFFTLALFGFSCLSSLSLFANERVLFMRERANGYYSPLTYFCAKVFFDILPLRVVPPMVFGAIIYGLVGLVPTVPAFWKFMLALVLFNLTTASIILLLSIAFASVSVATQVGTVIMLFNLLFAGLLVNRESLHPALQWLHTVSFFHAAYEALAVNELRYLQLKQSQYGVELDVPAATILSLFGLKVSAFWWPDIGLLGIFFGTTLVVSYLILHFYVKEKR